MTTFQSVVIAIIHGFAEFLPVSADAHDYLLGYILDWPVPTGAMAGALALGALMANLTYFRHDWASLLSSFLRVLLLRKRPMTLDERLPFFMIIALGPMVGVWYYLRIEFSGFQPDILWVIGAFGGFTLLLWLADRLGRKTKGMVDWNWVNSLTVGVTGILGLVHGAGRMNVVLIGALFRRYRLDAAAKFFYFLTMPILAAKVVIELGPVSFDAAEPMQSWSWLSFGVTVVVSYLSGLLAIGGFLKNLQGKSLGGYVTYRMILTVGIGGLYFLRLKGWV